MAQSMSRKQHTLTGVHASGNTWTTDCKNEREARQQLAWAIADNGYGNRAYATRVASAIEVGTATPVLHLKTGEVALTATITLKDTSIPA